MKVSSRGSRSLVLLVNYLSAFLWLLKSPFTVGFSNCAKRLEIMNDPMVAVNPVGLRRSRRIHARSQPQLSTLSDNLDGISDKNDGKSDLSNAKELKQEPTRKRRTTRSSVSSLLSLEEDIIEPSSSKVKQVKTKHTVKNGKKKVNKMQIVRNQGLSRTREFEIHKEKYVKEGKLVNQKVQVLGIDEAGRGPLAGPVVAAAVMLPPDFHAIPGVVDSKMIASEEKREEIYEKLTTIPNVRWAVSVIDAARIDEINILQATLEGMKMAMMALIDPQPIDGIHRVERLSIEQTGCYVVTNSPAHKISSDAKAASKSENIDYYALVDGNKLPVDMPCEGEAIVKGDSKECCIAAASIIAKVSRDRLMHGYHELYPHFNLKQHKGYPTAAHMAAVRKHGASEIHRLTFAPLKHMKFDKNGKIIGSRLSD